MPTFNGERWIRRAIDSILGQSYRNLELVICDNASTDATSSICREFAERDERVRYYRNQENIGLNANYNLVFRRASGKYFKWASCNDICAPQLIERCVGELENHPEVVLCYGRTRIVRHEGDAGELYEDNLNLQEATPYARMRHILESVRLNNVINGLTRADVLRRTMLHGDYFSSDLVLLVELALRGKFLEVADELFYRNMMPGTTTNLKSDEEQLAYFQPGLRNRMLFQHWKINWGYLWAATRAPLPAGERLNVYRYLLRRTLWDRHKLAKDLLFAGRSLLASRRASGSGPGR
jgi:glycosyltransferase involved in cell wall biosynthesis